jgi:hypothetical protein
VVFIASTPQLAVGQKATAFCRRVHRTVRCTTGHLLCSVRCTPRQPTVGACSSRPLDPTVAVCPWHTGQSGAHQTVRCYSQRAPVCGLSAQTVRCHTGQSGAHRTVRCYSQRAPVCGLSAQTVRCLTGQSGAHRTPMSGAPPGRWLTALILDFFTDFVGLLCS